MAEYHNSERAKVEAANLLVVDDDDELRELLDQYLSQQGFNVEVAAGDERPTVSAE